MPLFNRIAVFGCSCVMLCIMIGSLFSPKVRQDLDLGLGLLMLILVGIALYMMWLSVFYRADATRPPRPVTGYEQAQGFVYLGGALVGLFAGLALVSAFGPRTASAGTLALAMLIGGFCGAVGLDLSIRWIRSFTGISLTVPIGMAVGGAALGLIVGNLLGPSTNWSGLGQVVPIGVGFVGGLLLGILRRRS